MKLKYSKYRPTLYSALDIGIALALTASPCFRIVFMINDVYAGVEWEAAKRNIDTEIIIHAVTNLQLVLVDLSIDRTYMIRFDSQTLRDLNLYT